MAKKKRRIIEEEEEEYKFIPSEFDEREFILKDIYGTKVLFVVTAMAIILGIVGSLLCQIDTWGWGIATVLAFVLVIVMKKLLILIGFRADLLETKTLLMDYLIFLMLGLGVCILLLNTVFQGS
jgi:hypothetical protein